MCHASILRFCCGHGLLMGLEPCKIGPCPMIKTTGAKLPQQPFKCYNCQQRRTSKGASKGVLSQEASCADSTGTLDSIGSSSSVESSKPRLRHSVTAPLPGVIRQPAGTLQYCRTNTSRLQPKSRPFSFSCSSSSHHPNEHYLGLPGFLPHQDHPCPPCQVEDFRRQGDREVTLQARKEYPSLRGEMLVHNGRIRENWESNLTLETYISEKRTDEKQMWHHVVRKWTQDLGKLRVLVSEEDGLGLLS